MICQAEGCKNEIHPARLAAIPQTVTCRAECATARLKQRKAAAAAKSHRKSGYKAARASYRRRRGKGPAEA